MPGGLKTCPLVTPPKWTRREVYQELVRLELFQLAEEICHLQSFARVSFRHGKTSGGVVSQLEVQSTNDFTI
jgi:hypothetical protein